MRHVLAVLLVPVVVAVGARAPVAPAAPVPKHLMKDAPPAYYFPTTPGAAWEYESGQKFAVGTVQDVDGAKVVTVVTDRGVVNEEVRVSAGELARLGVGVTRFDHPLVFLTGPVKVGTTWEVKTSGAEGTARIAAVELLKVPAGTFEAVRVDLVQPRGGRERVITAWFARDVGLVRMTDDGKDIWVMKSFTPAK